VEEEIGIGENYGGTFESGKQRLLTIDVGFDNFYSQCRQGLSGFT
jgi:hypothetical protein